MKKSLCVLLSVLICFLSTCVSVSAQDTVYNIGDVDLDGMVNIIDATEIQRYLALLTDLSDTQCRLADVDSDGYVNIFDATTIQCYLAKIIDAFPGTQTPTEPTVANPVKVENVAAVATSETTIEIRYDAIEGAQKYWIYVNGAINRSITENHVVIPATPATTYEIRVTAKLADATSLKYNNADSIFVTTPQPATQTPTNKSETSIDSVAQKIKSYQTDSSLTLSLMSDTHYDHTDAADDVKVATMKSIGELQDIVNVDLTANLGDIVDGNTVKETTINSVKSLVKSTSEYCKSPLFFVRGNHDDNGWYSQGGYGGSYKTNEIINDVEWYNLAIKDFEKDFVTDPNKPYGGYGYFDHENSKIRVFLLNTSDIPYIIEDDDTYRYCAYTGSCFSNEQLNFVADSLMFSDKQNPSEWAALFLCHVPIDTSNHDGERFGGSSALIRSNEYMLGIINAYRKGVSFTAKNITSNITFPTDKAEDFKVEVNIDYSQKGNGEVIGFINGHTHFNNYSNSVGDKISQSYGYTYLSLVGSISFSNFIINRDECTITVVKYGRSLICNEPGVVVDIPYKGSIKSGEWTVKYSQFLPKGENLYNGLSSLYPVGNSFDSTSGINPSTMELQGATKTEAKLCLTKAVPVKPLTTYILPSDFVGDCVSFGSSGVRKTAIKISTKDGYKTITTNLRNSYVVFSLDTVRYPDYKNFFVKEQAYSLKY